MKRVQVSMNGSSKGPSHIAPVESTVWCSLPNLVQHCCVTRYDDGSPRQVGWLTVSTQGAVWTVVVKDPDAKAQMRVSGPTLDDALALADVLLGSDEAPWEVDRWAQERTQQKRK